LFEAAFAARLSVVGFQRDAAVGSAYYILGEPS